MCLPVSLTAAAPLTSRAFFHENTTKHYFKTIGSYCGDAVELWRDHQPF
jgi:hypothetical protein